MTRIYTDDAELYDIAFDWDISDEVDWLLARLGEQCRTLLEPGCGSGRMLAAFAERGLEAATYDGGRKGRWPRVPGSATGGLLWHELVC